MYVSSRGDRSGRRRWVCGVASPSSCAHSGLLSSFAGTGLLSAELSYQPAPRVARVAACLGLARDGQFSRPPWPSRQPLWPLCAGAALCWGIGILLFSVCHSARWSNSVCSLARFSSPRVCLLNLNRALRPSSKILFGPSSPPIVGLAPDRRRWRMPGARPTSLPCRRGPGRPPRALRALNQCAHAWREPMQRWTSRCRRGSLDIACYEGYPST